MSKEQALPGCEEQEEEPGNVFNRETQWAVSGLKTSALATGMISQARFHTVVASNCTKTQFAFLEYEKLNLSETFI